MIGKKKMFSSFKENEESRDSITFIDNGQGKVLGCGKIDIITDYSISKVLLDKSLDYNVLSVSQLF
jgi:hypothetical protein